MYSYLSESQKIAVDYILKGENVFVTGSAGTGKSYLLNFLKTELKDKCFYITATTGIASVNVGGITLHSWAGIGIEDIPVEKIAQKILPASGTHTRKRLQSTEILAVDEISMLSMKTFEKIDKLLRLVRDNNKPFGGIQLIFFGDFFQLPPVDCENFCFESNVWWEANIKMVLLREIFRQSDQTFITLLEHVRYGIISKNDVDILKHRWNLKYDGVIKPTILSTHNVFVEKINFEKLNNLTTKEYIYTARFDGREDKIELLKKNCIAREILNLKLGSQVMMLKNTYQKEGIINGSSGIVVDFSMKKHYPVVRFENGKELTIAPECWEISTYNPETGEVNVLASMVQIPLLLSWAITIHKSQGMTLDKAECDLKHVFTDGQVYVALSRVRDLNGLYIKSFDVNKIKANKKIIKFYDEVLK